MKEPQIKISSPNGSIRADEEDVYQAKHKESKKIKVIAQKRGLFEKEAYFNNLSVSLVH